MIEFDTSLLGGDVAEAARAHEPMATEHLRAIAEGACLGGEFTGWYDYPARRGTALAEEVAGLTTSIAVDYDSVVVIGIGGSYLGARAVHHALSGEWADGAASSPLPMYFAGHHLAARSHQQLLDVLKQKNPIINVISKSGTTTEPSIAFRIVRQFMESRYSTAELRQRMIVTTDAEKGALRPYAEAEKLRSFVVPSDIGGRFSVLSAVGLVPLALAGVDVCEMMRGAREMFGEITNSTAESPHAVCRYAAVRNELWQRGLRIEMFSYNDPDLMYLAEWWKQLFGESEGKHNKGLFPASMQLTTDLHSLGQFLQDGTRILAETFVTFDQRKHLPALVVPAYSDDRDQLGYLEGRSLGAINETARQATALAHRDGGVPCMHLRFSGDADARGLGAAFAFYEVACGVSALLLGVNPFDQPGVEAYKTEMFRQLGKPGFVG